MRWLAWQPTPTPPPPAPPAAPPANPWLPPVDGYRHLAEVVAWNHLVHDALLHELELGRLPILLGGDHCLGIGSISAVSPASPSRAAAQARLAR